MASNELALAFDQKTKKDFFKALELFEGLKIVVKVGLRLLPYLSPEDFKFIKTKGFKLFIDAKLHDIPSQVSDSVKTWSDLGADYLTLHLSGGRQMLTEAQSVASSTQTSLLGVSVLTSLAEKDLKELSIPFTVVKQVEALLRLGHDCGLRHFVCSAMEQKTLKNIFPDIHFVCPGIHLDHANASADQQRSVPLSEALSEEIFMPVIGRAVFSNPDPKSVCLSILKQMRIA